MRARQEWAEALLKARGAAELSELEKAVAGRADVRYPLLGCEAPADPVSDPAPWKLRLALQEPPPAAFQEALYEDLDQILWLGESVPEVPSHLESLRFVGREQDGAFRVVSKGGREVRERVYGPDLNLLRNIAEFRGARELEPDFDGEWVVCLPQRDGEVETESFVEDTLIMVSGVLAGATVLEIPQGGPDHLWSRVNVARILRWEAGLARSPQGVEGAGFFGELFRRLRAQ